MRWDDKTGIILLVSVPEKYLSYKVAHKNERLPLQACVKLGLNVEKIVRVTSGGLWKFYTPAIELVIAWCEENKRNDYLILVSDLAEAISEADPVVIRKLRTIARVHSTSDLFYELSLEKELNLVPEIYYVPREGDQNEERD